MKKLFLKLSLFIPIILVIVGFNYFMDPANLFSKGKYEYGIAKLISENNNVANLTNCDERILQKYISEMIKTKYDIMVLGSSRTMTIGNNLLEGKVFNKSVSGCSLEDLMSVYWVTRKADSLPKTIIVNLDPWVLNKNNNQTRYKSLQVEYDEIIDFMSLEKENITITDYIPEKLLHLFSFTYFRESLKAFAKKFTNNKEESYYPTKDSSLEVSLKLVDGSWINKKQEKETSLERANQKAINYANESPIYSLGNFKKISKDNQERFEKLISLMSKDNIKIVFLLTPYHPYVYNKLVNSEDYKIIVDVQKYFQKFASENNIKFIGSYNPTDLNLAEKDFIDGMHLRSESFKIFLNNDLIK